MEVALESALIYFQHWIIATFNKEGIFIFVVLCLTFFLLASFAAKWAIESGQFENIEEAKFEMMDT